MKRRLRHLLLALAFVLPVVFSAFPGTSSAGFNTGPPSGGSPGQQAIQELHAWLTDLSQNCGGLTNGALQKDNLDRCQNDVKYLSDLVGCSPDMIQDQGPNTAGTAKSPMHAYDVDQEALKSCKNSINDTATIAQKTWTIFNAVQTDCKQFDDGSSQQDTCQGYEDSLAGISCDSSAPHDGLYMTKTISSGGHGRGGSSKTVWVPKPQQLAKCTKIVNGVLDVAANGYCSGDKKYKGKELAACKVGFVAQTKGQDPSKACSKFKGNEQSACNDGASKAKPPGATAATSNNDLQLGCEASANPLSWVLCPIINDLLVPAISVTDGLITQEMVIPSQSIFCTGQQTCDAYYTAWSSFRDIALGLLAIAGLIVVISQAIGMEILDAYTIRKMLPRILVAAITITLSWTLMSFAVTLSNNLGFGVRDLITTPFHALNTTIGFSSNAGGIIGGFSALLLGGVAAVAAIGILLSYLATAGLAVLVAILVLVLRQIVIIMLMILSPVALIAYVLPNTQRVFRLWWESFSRALLMFPLIAAFIAAGRVFAAISLTNSQSLFSQITAFVAYFGPYFAIPLTFRMAGGIMSGVGNFMNQRAQPAFSRLSKYRGEKAAAKMKNARAGKLFDENFGRFNFRGKETGIGELANRLAVNVTDQDELLPWRLGKPRPGVTNPLTGKPWKGMWGMRRGAKDLQDQLDDRAISESQGALEEINKKGGMHYEGWRGISGQHQDYKGYTERIGTRADGTTYRKSVAQVLAEEGFVDQKTGAVKRPSSIGDFEKMGRILQESDNDKERLGGNDILAHSGTLASVKHRPDMEYADTQIMAAIAQSAAGRAEPKAMEEIGNSVEARLGPGVAQRTMKAAQGAASRQERPDLRDGHGIVRTKDGKWESVFSQKNHRSKMAYDNVLSIKGSAWSGAKAEAVTAASPTIEAIAQGKPAAGDESIDPTYVQSVHEMIRHGIQNPYNDAGQRQAWRKVAERAGLEDLAKLDTMSRQGWDLQQLAAGAGAGEAPGAEPEAQ